MGKIKKTKLWTFIVKFFLMIFGAIFICATVYNFTNVLVYSDGPDGITYLIATYITVVLAIFFIFLPFDIQSYKPYNVSLFSFYFYNFFFPMIIIIFYLFFYGNNGGDFFDKITLYLLQMNDLKPFTQKELFLLRSLLTQVIINILWFVSNINVFNKDNNVAIMKLDYYSTIVILPLTVVWVICYISDVKFQFAILLATFMLIQVFIKRRLIIIEENRNKQMQQ